MTAKEIAAFEQAGRASAVYTPEPAEDDIPFHPSLMAIAAGIILACALAFTSII